VSAMFDVDQFITACRSALAERQAPTAVKEVIERALSQPHEIDAALGKPERGGISTLHRSEDLTVLWVVWPPHVSLFPHDHRMWAANGIYGGREDNIFYRREANGIVRSGGKEIDAGEVALLGSDAIHSVANPRSSYAAAIHVYGGDFFATPRSQWDPSNLVEQPFDVEHARRVLAEADEEAKRIVDPSSSP
jgi:predicted metal-dependent enzyme (double-stranded beta helix superfamily)